MPEVERDPTGRLALVGEDHLDLRPRRPFDDLRERPGLDRRRVAPRDCRALRFQGLEQALVAERGHLHGLGQGRTALPDIQRRQDRHVGEDRGRLMERTDEILALRQVDAGLAADRRVELRDERRRDLDERDAAEVGRGKESRRIAERPAAEDHQRLAPLDPQPRQLARRVLDDGQALCVLALGEQHSLDRPAVHRQRLGHRCSDRRPRARLRDEDRATRLELTQGCG